MSDSRKKSELEATITPVSANLYRVTVGVAGEDPGEGRLINGTEDAAEAEAVSMLRQAVALRDKSARVIKESDL